MTKKQNDLKTIADLIYYHFGDEDYYSAYENIKNMDYIAIRDDMGNIIAYNIHSVHTDNLQGIRSGVLREWRGQGLATQLYRKVKDKARRKEVPYTTYTSHDNIASIRSHIRAGMNVTKIDDSFIYFST